MKDYSVPLADALRDIVANGIEGTSLAEPATKLDLMELGIALFRIQLNAFDLSLSKSKSDEERKIAAEALGRAVAEAAVHLVNVSSDHAEIFSKALDEYANAKG